MTYYNRKNNPVDLYDYIYHLSPKYAKNIPKHVGTGLKCIGDWDTLKRYKNCRKGAYCGLRFCESCRERAARGLEYRFWKHYWNVLGSDETLARQRLQYVTFLSELVTNDQNEVNAATKRMRGHLKKLKRKFPGIWIEGSIEVEPIDQCYVQGALGEGTKKRDTINAMMANQNLEHGAIRESKKHIFLLHYHALLDVSSHNLPVIKKEYMKMSKAHHRQWHMQKLRYDYTLQDSFRRIANYGFKDWITHNYDWSCQEAKGKPKYTYGELGSLVSLYAHMSGTRYKGQLIGIGRQD